MWTAALCSSHAGEGSSERERQGDWEPHTPGVLPQSFIRRHPTIPSVTRDLATGESSELPLLLVHPNQGDFKTPEKGPLQAPPSGHRVCRTLHVGELHGANSQPRESCREEIATRIDRVTKGTQMETPETQQHGPSKS